MKQTLQTILAGILLICIFALGWIMRGEYTTIRAKKSNPGIIVTDSSYSVGLKSDTLFSIDTTVMRTTSNSLTLGNSTLSGTVTFDYVGITNFNFNNKLQFSVKHHNKKGQYLIHMKRNHIWFMNDSTAIYTSNFEHLDSLKNKTK